MTSWRAALEVARWEFQRYIKPKQQTIGMIVTFVIFGGFMAISRASSGDGAVREVAVIGSDILPIETLQPQAVRFTAHAAAQEAELRQRVRDRDLDGVLIIRDVDNAELAVRRVGTWTGELRALIAAARQQQLTARAGLSTEVLAHILTPPRVVVTQEARAGGSRGERLSLIIVVSLMLMAVFIGMSYIFTSITGEKQIRVTEQVVSAIPAQAWIDGKIIGLIGVSVIGVFAQVVAFAAVYVAMRRFGGAPALPLPDTLGHPGTVALLLLFAVLGLFFWFAFLAAVAATIDDPQNSTRGSLLFVPIMASSAGYLVLNDPDSALSRTLALLPPTAPSAMPVRLLTTDVSAPVILLSLLLLLAGIAALRIVAGRIFRLGMLMYGKEPTWSDLRRWALRG